MKLGVLIEAALNEAGGVPSWGSAEGGGEGIPGGEEVPARSDPEHDLGPDPESPVGMILDQIIQIVNVYDLIDPYMGAHFDHSTRDIWLYFSDGADRDHLQVMADAIVGSKAAADAQVYASDGKEESVWVVAIGQAAPAASDPKLSGDAGGTVDISGELDVSGKEQQTTDES